MLGKNFGFSGGGSSTPPPATTSWLLDGNTFGSEKYFGTNDNFSIPIYTNGIVRGIFDNSGNFGFGISAGLTARVHIKGLNDADTHYVIKSANLSDAHLFCVRNDGYSTIYTSAAQFAGEKLSVGGTILVSMSGYLIKDGNGTDYWQIFSGSRTFGIVASGGLATILTIDVNNPFYITTHAAYNIGFGIAAPLAKLHVFGISSGSINQRLEPVTGVTEDTTGNTVATTDATANVTAQTIAIPTGTVLSLDSTIVYRKTGGAGVGTTGDGTTIKLNSSVKNVGGTLTLDIIQNTYTGITNAIAGVSATYTVSGTNVLVSVTGVVNDNITWNVITKVNTVA